MFEKQLETTPLTTTVANSVFSKISYEYINGDSSFGATLRALVYPRMEENDYLGVRYSYYSTSAMRRSRYSTSRAINDVVGEEHLLSDTILIYDLRNGDQNENIAWMEMMRSDFTEVYPGYTHIEKVAEFFKKVFHVACFINTEQKTAILFTENLDLRHMHYLQCAIPAFLPWYFNPEEGLREIEMELIFSLREKTSDHYEAILAKIAEGFNMREISIRNSLNGFEARGFQSELRSISREIENINYEVEQYNRRIYDKLSLKREREIRYLGVQAKIASVSEESEMMDYFLHNKSLFVYSVGNDNLMFEVYSYLEYFDEDVAQTVINNRESYVYRLDGQYMSNLIPKDDMCQLMTAIFVDRNIKMRFCAAYNIKLGNEVDGLRGHDFSVAGYMPNPHIHYHSCLGDYRPIINEMLLNGNYVGCVEQCCASSRSLNFGDGIVMGEFMRNMYSRECMPCIELPDGSVVTPRDAIKWLKRGEEGSNE